MFRSQIFGFPAKSCWQFMEKGPSENRGKYTDEGGDVRYPPALESGHPPHLFLHGKLVRWVVLWVSESATGFSGACLMHWTVDDKEACVGSTLRSLSVCLQSERM